MKRQIGRVGAGREGKRKNHGFLWGLEETIVVKDIADLTRKVGAAAKSLSPKPVKLLKPIGKELTRPIGSVTLRGLSIGAENAFGKKPFNRRGQVPGVLGGKTGMGGIGSRSFAGKSRHM